MEYPLSKRSVPLSRQLDLPLNLGNELFDTTLSSKMKKTVD